MVEMFVYRIAMDQEGQAFVVLMDTTEERMLPIVIGPYEAHAIAMVLHGEAFRRPLTHDLFINTLTACGRQVRRLEITRLEDSTYYAVLHVTDGRQVVEVDARPSDGIALAMRAQAPIYVAEEVLAVAEYRTVAGDDQAEAEQFRELMQRVRFLEEPEEEEGA